MDASIAREVVAGLPASIAALKPFGVALVLLSAVLLAAVWRRSRRVSLLLRAWFVVALLYAGAVTGHSVALSGCADGRGNGTGALTVTPPGG